MNSQSRTDWLGAETRRRVTRSSYARGLGLFALDVTFWLLCVFVAVCAESLVLRAFAAVLGGLAVTLLFVIGHDACHQSLTPGRLMNHIVGRLAFLPCMHTFSLWELAHNRLHHGHTNLLAEDYVWRPMTPCEYGAASPLRRLVYRFERSALGFLTYYPTRIWLAKLALPVHRGIGRLRPTYFADSALIWTFAAAWAWAVVELGAWAEPERSALDSFALGWLVPFLVFNWLIGAMIYLQHTHPRVPWFAKREEWSFQRGQVAASVHIVFPEWLDRFFQRILHHTAHHVNTRIPIYHLSEAQAALEAEQPSTVVRLRWTLASHLGVVRTCKLYDPERHQWCGFDGKPTAAPIDLAAG